MRRLVIALLIVEILASACLGLRGCRGVPAFPSGTWSEASITLCVGRSERTADLFAPDPWPNATIPLLLMLHGGGGNAKQFAEQTRLAELADEHGIMVVFPQGTPNPRRDTVRTWNAMHCCGEAYRDDVDDVAFLGDLIELLLQHYPIDPARVGVAGHSNGGMMAYRLASERSDIVTIAMPVAGSIGGNPDPGDPVRVIRDAETAVSILIIHSAEDPRVPFEGGQGENLDGPRVDLSVADAVAHWRRVDGIDDRPRYVNRSDHVLQEIHEGGKRGTQVMLLGTTGGHGWPGSEQGTFNDAPAVPDASREIVSFLLSRART